MSYDHWKTTDPQDAEPSYDPNNVVQANRLRLTIFRLVEESEPERRAELERLLEGTWFGSPESIDEFAAQFPGHPIAEIAREYVDNASE